MRGGKKAKCRHQVEKAVIERRSENQMPQD
jgi:hypothetical protein